ncbi:MAG: rod shape-determining protein RodA [Deltaproteobacteria bacterium]|nr:rod shape-determining protein RodA [Deltaproteobacteria bacterium]
MIDRRLISNFDWALLGITLFFSILGIINLYSASYSFSAGRTPVYMKHIYYILMGLAGIVIVLQIDYKNLERYAYWIYAFSVLLLVAVLLVGKTGGGARRWIGIMGGTYQPSELMKLALILALSKYFYNRNKVGGYYLRELIVPFMMVGVPSLLIMKQPDLGTALILLSIFGSIILFAGVRLPSLLIAGSSLIAGAPILWRFMKDYQKMRLMTFLNPEADPLGSGYHIIQSKIAVGSGKIFGRGLLSGTQSQLQFLPEHHTDFIFSVLAEEWGFIGSMIVIMGFLFLVLWGVSIAKECKDRFGTILSFGVIAMISWHFLINIGMVVGLMPVVGVPLPFFSYGGSFLITILLGIGILLNIRMRRFA